MRIECSIFTQFGYAQNGIEFYLQKIFCTGEILPPHVRFEQQKKKLVQNIAIFACQRENKTSK